MAEKLDQTGSSYNNNSQDLKTNCVEEDEMIISWE